ncbi:MAG TPA: hypothetical protein VGB07_25710 [Blastocatellia bacterium]|jgi:uncharacterized protein YrrD
MKTVGAINIEKQLKGCMVLDEKTAGRLGQVSDALIHPSRGTVLGLLICHGAGIEKILSAESFVIHDEAKAVTKQRDARRSLKDSLKSRRREIKTA